MESGDHTFHSHDQRIDPELDNFLGRVDEVAEIIRGLASDNAGDYEKAMRKADMLIRDDFKDFDEENVQCKVTNDRSVINKAKDEGETDKDVFMKMMEKDADDRARERRARKEKSAIFRKSGNNAFSKGNYAEALSSYNQAIDLVKDSPCLYNNRALTYIRIGVYTKAIEDCERAIELADYSMKARFLKAKAHFLKGETEQSMECLREAEEKYPPQSKMIKHFEKELLAMKEKKATTGEKDKSEGEDGDKEVYFGPEQMWRNASNHNLWFQDKAQGGSGDKK